MRDPGASRNNDWNNLVMVFCQPLGRIFVSCGSHLDPPVKLEDDKRKGIPTFARLAGASAKRAGMTENWIV
jgi:hypothetical protein